MKVILGEFDFTILWEGVYYKALSNYPEVTTWEMKNLRDFVNYEKAHGRDTEFESEDPELLALVQKKLDQGDSFESCPRPDKITECTACKHKGCLTDYLCHTASLENALEILKSGALLSAEKARKMSLSALKMEQRNMAQDPEDFFQYVMLSWGNCQAGDRLVMERKLGRLPTEEDLSTGFTPGIRFFFKYEALEKHPSSIQDGYHAMKIKDELILKDYVYKIVVPQDYQKAFDNTAESLKDKILYLHNDTKDIWEWSEKVYGFIEERK